MKGNVRNRTKQSNEDFNNETDYIKYSWINSLKTYKMTEMVKQ